MDLRHHFLYLLVVTLVENTVVAVYLAPAVKEFTNQTQVLLVSHPTHLELAAYIAICIAQLYE